MPIYEYKCQECGKISEFLIHNSSVTNTLTCVYCKSTKLDRVLSVPSLIKDRAGSSGETCCGRAERCENPPCSSGGSCCRD